MNLEKFKTRLHDKKAEKMALKEKEIYHKNILKMEKESRNEKKEAPKDSFISLIDINKIYPNHIQAVYDFNLNIKEHEFIVLVGPSGCGKSTTLRMVAGLESITSGSLFIDGLYANELPPKDRDIAMVFQSYALYPHMTVFENMAFGLKVNHFKKDEIEKRVLNAAKILDITELLNRKPSALSGGQCQRVALGRAIVRNSKLFLMDEPLSNLDAKLRVQMRSEIVKLHKALNSTTIYVTHDQTEAMTMASRIVVMKKGYIQQIGTPSEIYNNPENIFVATFIGSPAMNILNAKIKDNDISVDGTFKLKLDDNILNEIKDFYKKELILTTSKANAQKEKLYLSLKDQHQFKKLVKNEEKNIERIKSKISKEYQEKYLVNENNDLEYLKNILYKQYVLEGINSLTKNSFDESFKEFDLETINKLEKLILHHDIFNEINNLYVDYLKEYIFALNSVKNEFSKTLRYEVENLNKIEDKGEYDILFGIRPEDIHDSISHPNVHKYEEFEVKVSVAELLGHEYYLHFDTASGEMISKNTVNRIISSGDNIRLFFSKDKIHLFDPITKKRIL